MFKRIITIFIAIMIISIALLGCKSNESISQKDDIQLTDNSTDMVYINPFKKYLYKDENDDSDKSVFLTISNDERDDIKEYLKLINSIGLYMENENTFSDCDAIMFAVQYVQAYENKELITSTKPINCPRERCGGTHYRVRYETINRIVNDFFGRKLQRKTYIYNNDSNNLLSSIYKNGYFWWELGDVGDWAGEVLLTDIVDIGDNTYKVYYNDVTTYKSLDFKIKLTQYSNLPKVVYNRSLYTMLEKRPNGWIIKKHISY